MKLEVGMYARTINGKIWIIISQKAISGHRKDIIKASHNIIDLIGVGDYVNGVEVNTHKAIFWYRKDAAKGNEEAKECLKRLGSNWIVDGEIEDYYIDE